MPADITVEVHEELRPLLPGFLSHRQHDLEQLSLSLESADFPAIEQIAHNMKGVGAGYGFPQVSELGLHLELAARQADPVAAARCLADYRDFMLRCRVVFV